ncbi:MAG TPA: YdcF family protein [Polyangia bacterium]|jgi:uncharacterized SAM-binding protein YcdF (DUF218 family)
MAHLRRLAQHLIAAASSVGVRVARRLPAAWRRLAASAPCRAGAWLLGAFILCNAAGELLRPGFAADHVWIRTAQLVPGWRVPAFALALALLVPEHRLRARPRLRAAAAALAAAFAVAALVDAGRFYALLGAGRIATPAIVPFSALVAALLAATATRLRGPGASASDGGTARAVATTAGVLVIALGALVAAYGLTDYARPADCAVVLGARAYADGTASLALHDRTMTGVALYRRGFVRRLVMSGGVEANGVSEPAVMRAIALEAGVPAQDIILDEQGRDSWATVRNARALAARHAWREVLLVSHYYHLPRLRLAADRAGLPARTVPCHQTRRLAHEPWSIVREGIGLAYYYLVHLPPRA